MRILKFIAVRTAGGFFSRRNDGEGVAWSF